MTALRRKSVALTGYLETLVQRDARGARCTILTPAEPSARGAALSLRAATSTATARARCSTACAARGIVPDWREPDVIRAAPVPFYNTLRRRLALRRRACARS